MASKILKYNDRYVIFYTDTCIFCTKAIELLKLHKIPFKSYNIDKIKGGAPKLLLNLIKHKKQLNFDTHHNTKPIIFKHGKFLGGFMDLYTSLQ